LRKSFRSLVRKDFTPVESQFPFPGASCSSGPSGVENAQPHAKSQGREEDPRLGRVSCRSIGPMSSISAGRGLLNPSQLCANSRT
jgi:hypothetical protein